MKEKKDKNILTHKILEITIYGNYNLNIVIAKNICKARNKFHEQLDGLISEDEEWGGLHSYKGGCTFESYIFLPEDCRSDVIAHESFHAAVRIMRIIGAKLSRSSEESYAYLLDHIVGFITELFLELDKK